MGHDMHIDFGSGSDVPINRSHTLRRGSSVFHLGIGGKEFVAGVMHALGMISRGGDKFAMASFGEPRRVGVTYEHPLLEPLTSGRTFGYSVTWEDVLGPYDAPAAKADRAEDLADGPAGLIPVHKVDRYSCTLIRPADLRAALTVYEDTDTDRVRSTLDAAEAEERVKWARLQAVCLETIAGSGEMPDAWGEEDDEALDTLWAEWVTFLRDAADHGGFWAD